MTGDIFDEINPAPRLCWPLLILLMAKASSALAADAEGRWLTGALWTELRGDAVEASDDADGAELRATVAPSLALHLSPELRFEGGLIHEALHPRAPGEIVPDHGTYVGHLQLVHESDGVMLRGGKFAPAFGLAIEGMPGLYSDTFSESYELSERLGVGGAIERPNWALHFSAFKRDDSPLRRSLFVSRPEIEGGPGLTDLPTSAALAFDLQQEEPGLRLRGSLLRQDNPDGKDQWAWGLGASYRLALGDALEVAPMLDVVRNQNAFGIKEAVAADGLRQDIATLGLGVTHGPWRAALAGGLRFDRIPEEGTARADFLQISGGYDFGNGITVQVGWLRAAEPGWTAELAGFQLGYEYQF